MRSDRTKNNKKSGSELLSSLFCVAGEMKENNGEDSYYYAANDNRVVVSVFDGCGGIGSRRYENYSGKTGAYVASRAVCGGVKSWFENRGNDKKQLMDYINRTLRVCDNFADKKGRLMGSLGKSFPTTAAVILAEDKGDGRVSASCYWAGDSRCYLLDLYGLHQLSADDVEGEDAYSNLSGDGVLKNVISASAPFTINHKDISVSAPCILFTATDGCFGYMNTPMEFEYLLLDSCVCADSVTQWRQNLDGRIQTFAGDDYTMSVAAFGFPDYDAMKKTFISRRDMVKAQYLNSPASVEDKWNSYKTTYYSY